MLVEFKVRRMGGSFGGKLKAPIALTCMAAIGAAKHGRPVRIVCDMHTNMNCFGKRLPYYAKYTVSAHKKGRGELQFFTLNGRNSLP